MTGRSSPRVRRWVQGALACSCVLLGGGLWVGCAAGDNNPTAGRDGAADGMAGMDGGRPMGTDAASDSGTGTDSTVGVDAGPGDAGPMVGICEVCGNSAQCGPEARCIELTGGQHVCVPTCVPDTPTCSRGFDCIMNFSAPDHEVCVPIGEKCCVDQDGDDYGVGAGCDGLDCDDAVATSHPMAREECNGVDDDCDGNVDSPLPMGACTGGRMCADGACTCPAGTTDCGDAGCVDTMTDTAHCGMCGHACTASMGGTAACAAGACGTACGDACGSYACDGARGVCFTMCRDDSMCATGFACRMGMCLPAPGRPCMADGECASGFCTDGVCCMSRCDGACESCGLPTRQGFCDPVPAGDDPDSDCAVDDIMTCDRDGTCDGHRRCALYAMGRVCTPPTCMGAMSRRASHCDGFGNCEASTSDSCPPYSCDPASGMCNVSCSDDAQCIAGYSCAGGMCRRSRGQSCMNDAECATGFCTDGICCESRCNGACERCDASGRVGYCDAIPAGDDPSAECATTLCGSTGVCDGMRMCARHMVGEACAMPTCMSGTVSNLPDTCNAAEMCVDGGVRDCSPGTCNPATGLCRTTCMSTAECASGYTCSGGTCLKNDGQSCTVGTECLSGACCAGFCRNLTNDLNNCGACNTQCTNGHGTTSCSGSLCQPVCTTGYGNCDSIRPNGCETSLRTLTDCNACGVACSLPNAGESCTTGSCVITTCSIAYANCDTSQANGCEVSLASYSNTCSGASDIGSHAGDTSCNSPFCGSTTWQLFNSSSGRGSSWFHARNTEDSICSAGIQHRITLTVPADADYDLFVYRSCGGAAVAQSRLGTGMTDQVVVSQSENSGTDDSFDYWVEVRWYSGSSCGNWGISFEGRNC